jgi:hypothetical protein
MRERLPSLRESRCLERPHGRIPIQIMGLQKCFNPLAPIVVAETSLGCEGVGPNGPKGGESRRNVKRGAKNGGGLALPPATVGITHLCSQPESAERIAHPECAV